MAQKFEGTDANFKDGAFRVRTGSVKSDAFERGFSSVK
jgi:hypothetical protein